MTEERAKDPVKAAAGRKGAYSRTKHSNGVLSRKERGFDAEDIRKKIKVGMLTKKLEDAAEGKVELTPTQVQAAKILLDRCVPILSSVENTTHEQMPEEGEIIGRIGEMLSNSPDLIRNLPESVKASLLAALTGKPQTVASEQQTTPKAA